MRVRDGDEVQPKPRGFNAHEVTVVEQEAVLAEEAQDAPEGE